MATVKTKCENCGFVTLMERESLSSVTCEKCNSKAVNVVADNVSESMKSPKIRLNG